MRLCRYQAGNGVQVGLYDERGVVPLVAAAAFYAVRTGKRVDVSASHDLLHFLPPDGPGHEAAKEVAAWVAANHGAVPPEHCTAVANAKLLVPIPEPKKLFLLAGNYAEHIREGGGVAAEQAETFPYVFMKPPSTTLTASGSAIKIPRAAPNEVDWELELVIVIGKKCKGVSEADALKYVAGYTVANDISQRKYRPNPGRKKRDRDQFFDWLHGKWFDTFCPLGPCVASADAVNPDALPMKLTLNGQVKQDSSTAKMIFPVAAIIEFISAMVTLEPGDLISTGTPAGVGHTTGTFVKPGDVMHGTIDGIGTLVTPVEAEG